MTLEWYWVLALLFSALVIPMTFGVPVAFGFLAVNLAGAWFLFGGWAGVQQMVYNTIESLVSFSLTPIPMFLLMGDVLFRSGVGSNAIDAIDRLITKVPGRLSLVAISGGTVFAALSGSTVATTTMLGSLLLPEMRRRGYDSKMSMGPIMAVGGIDMLIPPSGLAVLLGSITGISIAGILIGGLVPGLILVVLFFGYIILRCWLNPALAPAYPLPSMPFWERIRPSLVYVLPLTLLFLVVIGSMMAGVATPTESAALGAAGAVITTACYGKLTWRVLRDSLVQSAKISIMIFLIIGTSLTFSQILGFSGATNGLVEWINGFGLSATQLMIAMLLVVVILGCPMDSFSVMMITMPLFMPLVKKYGIDEIWFGILMLLALEMGLISPPFGNVLFAMRGVTPREVSMAEIYASVMPFFWMEVVVLFLLVYTPSVVTWLPGLIR
jgi:tripartite ATP-independent transporter DctM subunit